MSSTLSKTVYNPKDQFRRGFIAGRHRGIDSGWDKDYLVESYKNLVSADGKVVSVYRGNDYNGGWGRRVVIEVTDRARIAYAHFASIHETIATGKVVRAGIDIGPMGSSGASTGDHQHFELYIDGVRVDPKPYLDGKPLPGTPTVTPAAPAGTGATGLRQRRVRRGDFKTLNGRNKPSTKSGTVKQELRPNLVANFDAFKRGERVKIGDVVSDIWFRGAFNGNWFAAAGFTSQSTAGLKDLGRYTEPKKEAKKTWFTTPANGQFYYKNYRDAMNGENWVKTALPGNKTYEVTQNPSGAGSVRIYIPGVGNRWVGTRNNPAKVTRK